MENLSIREYLAFERASEFRHEYLDGQLREREGASLNHNYLNVNIMVALHNQLRAADCVVMSSNMRVRVPGAAFYCYPDTLVVCGAVEVEDEHEDTLLNPCVVVEILSPTTEAFDRGEKWGQYQGSKVLRDYLLVAQDRLCIEHHTRQDDNLWLLRTYENADDTIAVSGAPVVLSSRDIYEHVTFSVSNFTAPDNS